MTSLLKIGAHVSAAFSLELSFERAKEIGADCTQIFISPPRQWLQIKHDTREIHRYRKVQKESGIGPNFIHGTYLINLGTENPELLKKSINWLIYAMNMAAQLQMDGVIFHLGSHLGKGFEKRLNQVVKALHTILAAVTVNLPIVQNTVTKPYLVLETSAGAGGNMGGKFEELGKILKEVWDNRLKVCLDTQHAFAAGYDLTSQRGMEKTLSEFDQEIGLTNLAVIHTNDSKTELGSCKDRHENIGEGFIRTEGFACLINHPKLQSIPFILEVPGFSGNGPDRENIQNLKDLVIS